MKQFLLSALILPLLLTHCAPRHYDWRQPPGGPAAEAAWFSFPPVSGTGMDNLRLDGMKQPFLTDNSTIFAINPGRHTFSVGFSAAQPSNGQNVGFQAAAGRHYRAVHDVVSTRPVAGGYLSMLNYRIEQSEGWTEERKQKAIAKLDQRR